MLNVTVAYRPQSGSYLTVVNLSAAALILALAAAIAVTPLPWLLVVLGAALGMLLTLIFPWLAWLGLAFALPIASGWRIGPASLTDLIFAAALALWCASIISQRRSLRTPRLPVWSVALYLLVLYVASLGASNLDEALTEMVKWVEFGALLLILPMAVPAKFLPWLVAALLSAAALQGIYGLYQFVFRIGPDWFLIQGRFMRASGVFGQPNPFGAYLGLSLPVAFSLALWGISDFLRQRRMTTAFWTIFYLAACLCIGVGLVASWSRGGWLGAVAAVVVVLAFFHRRTATLLGLGILVLTAAALLGMLNPGWVPSAISARLADIPAYLGLVDVLSLEVNDDNFAIIERVAHWVAAIRMWESAPWLGVGPGNYAAAYPQVALPRWPEPLGHAHNIYLNVLGETGLLGMSTFLLMWASLVGWLRKQMQSVLPPESWSRALAVGVLGVLAHLAVHSLFDNLFVQGMYLHVAFWLAAVAISAASPLAMDSSSSRPLCISSLPERDG
ncbi:MAG: O-antigen ligase family protein [Caldilineaceae bacterium]|nr:O-antigen ligase family protein [Caldilineaceae bacterium]